MFTIFYALFGIPLFLIALADLGSFVKSSFLFIFRSLSNCCKKKKNLKAKSVGEHTDEEESAKSQAFSIIMDFLLIISVFLIFILLGAMVLPWWEKDLSAFNAAYFTFISISTIGLGDIGTHSVLYCPLPLIAYFAVPQNMQFLPLTLFYIAIGVWLTTRVIEKTADVFKLIHYAGRRVTDISNVSDIM